MSPSDALPLSSAISFSFLPENNCISHIFQPKVKTLSPHGFVFFFFKAPHPLFVTPPCPMENLPDPALVSVLPFSPHCTTIPSVRTPPPEPPCVVFFIDRYPPRNFFSNPPSLRGRFVFLLFLFFPVELAYVRYYAYGRARCCLVCSDLLLSFRPFFA